jgi:glyceraldehyde 3-phosphate dehydrogenase
MKAKIGINGFGAIGRRVLRIALGHPAVEVVAVNDLGDPAVLAHLLKYDSTYGTLREEVAYHGGKLRVGNRIIAMFAEKDPSRIAWGEAGVDIVTESTGVFNDGQKALAHLQGGATKVIITAPAKNHDLTVVLGVNEDRYDPERHHIISNASCTTNCLAPMAMVLDREFGIISGMMCTVHSYTNDQQLLDFPHRDWRRARSGAMAIIPTTTGAASAVAEVLPHLKGKLNGMAMRVPTPAVSVVDFTVRLQKKVTASGINEAFYRAASSGLKGIMAVCDLPLVSVDFKGATESVIVDALSTQVVGDMAKVVGWYDNEWGYACRVVELAGYVCNAKDVPAPCSASL